MGTQDLDQLLGASLLGLVDTRPAAVPVDGNLVLSCLQGLRILDVRQGHWGFFWLARGVAVTNPAARPQGLYLYNIRKKLAFFDIMSEMWTVVKTYSLTLAARFLSLLFLMSA